ncbi:MAG: hypothetical protein ACSLFK_00080 [Gemmatimonadaceae bacterium]
MTLAVGGKALGASEELMVIQHDSHKRLEAVAGFLIREGYLRLTENGKFADFAIVHGQKGLALDCDWLLFELTDEGGQVSFRRQCEYVRGLANFATEYEAPAWIDQLGHGFMLKTDEDFETWVDFNTGRTLVRLKS